MTAPLLSVIIPTAGRPTLDRLLASIRDQAPREQVEVLVIGDTYAGTFVDALTPVPALCRQYRARYLGYDGGLHCVGQPQRNYGMTRARGQWLAFSQDDNVWRPGAWDAIHASITASHICPRLFKVHVRHGFVVWQQEGHLALGHVDADCAVVPNDPRRLGQWGLTYTGDWEFIRDTVALWDDDVQWEPFVIADGRPVSRRVFGVPL